MADIVIVALITGGCSVVGVILTNIASNRNIEQQLEKAQAVTDVKLDQLTEEVRKHNSFGDRITTAENRIKGLEERVDRMDARIVRYHEQEH